MRMYGNSYRGRVYTFEVVALDGNVVYLQNIETFSKSKVNSQFVYCKDGFVQVGDIIQRQYVREGVGLYNGGGIYSSDGNTSWTNITSQERWEESHPVSSFSLKAFSGIGAFALALTLLIPPLGIALLGVYGICSIIATIIYFFSKK